MTATREKPFNNLQTEIILSIRAMATLGKYMADVRRAISDDDNEIAQVKTFH